LSTCCVLLACVVVSLLLPGCSSYVTRTVSQSISRIGTPIPDPPRMITTPVLPDPELAVSWVGHATVLIQIHDKLFITDPLFTNTIGMLVTRFVKPGLDPAILPKLDFTLISHMHMDHLSYGSLGELPKDGILIFPTGLTAYVPEFGFRDVVELGKWGELNADSVRITAVPVQHFSGRYGFDGAWLGAECYTGYVIEYRGVVVFFAGDTGYDPDVFKEIGRRFRIDLAIVPIAPGGPTGLGGRVHVNPNGALQILKDVGARFLMPMHFGTMYYGSVPSGPGPLEQLRVAAEEQGLSQCVIGLEVGEQRVVELHKER
jgi:N-acyl-phosphatidylethanolamine-hydrolysing phospholipase D